MLKNKKILSSTNLFFVKSFAFFFISYLIFLIYFVLFFSKNLRNKFLSFSSKFFSQTLINFTKSKVEVIGLENIPSQKNILYIANHQSYFDIPLAIANLPGVLSFVAKKELFKIPILYTWMRIMNCIKLDRNNLRKSVKAISEASSKLNKGNSILIFPEGTRSKTGEMQMFKQGSFKIAFNSTDSILIPITFNNSYQIWKKRGK